MNLQQRADEIRKLGKQTVENIVRIGHHLIACKKEVKKKGHGNWLKWLKDEFNWSQQTADRFIRIAQTFPLSKLLSLSNLKIGVGQLHKLISGTTQQQRKKVSKSLAKGKGFPSARTIEKRLKAIKPINGGKKTISNKPIKMPKGRVFIGGLKDDLEDFLKEMENLDLTEGRPAEIAESITLLDKITNMLRQTQRKMLKVIKGGKS
jgi:Protein of unknown function (DUF3102)